MTVRAVMIGDCKYRTRIIKPDYYKEGQKSLIVGKWNNLLICKVQYKQKHHKTLQHISLQCCHKSNVVNGITHRQPFQ